MKKNLFKILLLIMFVMTISLTIIGCDCSSKSRGTITFLPEEEMDIVYVGQEFDVLSIVADSEGEEIKLTECYYLDGSFERHDLDIVDGTKFTTFEEYDVMITLGFVDEDIKGSAEYNLKVEVPATDTQLEWIKSWNEGGFTKKLSAKPDYLYDGVDSVLRVDYLGTVGGGTFMEVFEGKNKYYYIPDNADNVVLSVKVRNVSDIPVRIGLQLFDADGYHILPSSHPHAGQVSYYPYNPQMVVEANSDWVEYNVSLRLLGVDSSNIRDLTARIISGKEETADNYRYTLLIGSVDLVEYSAERFPDLETRTEREIKEELLANVTGDQDDKDIFMTALQSGHPYARGFTVKPEVLTYANTSGVTAPSAIASTSTSFVKFTTTFETHVQDYNGWFLSIPFNLQTSKDGLWKEEYAEFDQSNAYLGFYVYHNNPNDESLTFKLIENKSTGQVSDSNGKDGIKGTADDVIIIKGQKTVDRSSTFGWTYVEMSLENIEDITSEEQVLYVLATTNKWRSGGETGIQLGESFVYYVDGFSIYEGSKFHGDKDDIQLANGFGKFTTTNVNYAPEFPVTATSVWYSELDGIVAPAGLSSNGAVKYSLGSLASEVGTSKDLVSVAINLHKVGGVWKDEYASLNKADAYVGFWVYNINYTAPLNFGLVDYSTGSFNRYSRFGDHTKDAITDAGIQGEWVYVELSLANIKANSLAEVANTLYVYADVQWEPTPAAGQTFDYLIDGVSVYEGSKIPGDPEDKDLYSARGNYNGVYQNASAPAFPLNVEIVNYADLTGITAPEGLTGSTGAVKYSLGYLEGQTGNKYLGSAPVSLMNSKGYWNETYVAMNKDNTYVGFWVYNDYGVSLSFGLCQSYSNNDYPRLPGLDGNNVVKSTAFAKNGEWTYIELSCAGIDPTYWVGGQNRLYVGACVQGAAPTEGQSYVYYIDGFSIYEGSKIPGDADDKEISMTALQSGHPYARGFSVTPEVVPYDNNQDGITVPTGIASTSYVKMTTKFETHVQDYNGWFLSIPFNLQTSKDGLWKEEYAEFDQSNAYLGFYVYHNNPNDESLTFKLIENKSTGEVSNGKGADGILGTADDVIIVKAQKNVERASSFAWTYVEMSLENIEDITAEEQVLYVLAQNSQWRSGGETGIQLGESFVYYVDGFSIYEGSKLPGERSEEKMVDSVIEKVAATNSQYAITSAEYVLYEDIEVTAPTGLTSESAVKYTVSRTYNNTHYFSASVAINLVANRNGYWNKTWDSLAWADTYLGFWIKLDYAKAVDGVCIGLVNDGEVKTLTPTVGVQTIFSSDEWQYIEIPVTKSDLQTDGVNTAYVVLRNVSYANNQQLQVGESYTYYIDGLNIYEGSVFPGDKDDKGLVNTLGQFTPLNTYSANFPATAEVVEYKDLTGITAPTGLATTAATKYSLGHLSTTATGSKDLYSVAVNLHRDGGAWTIAYDSLDKANAYVGFWVYNINYAKSLSFGVAQYGGAFSACARNATDKIKAQTDEIGVQGEWVYVELSLAGINEETLALGADSNTMFVYARADWALVPTEGQTFEYLIDGFSVYEGSKVSA